SRHGVAGAAEDHGHRQKPAGLRRQARRPVFRHEPDRRHEALARSGAGEAADLRKRGPAAQTLLQRRADPIDPRTLDYAIQRLLGQPIDEGQIPHRSEGKSAAKIAEVSPRISLISRMREMQSFLISVIREIRGCFLGGSRWPSWNDRSSRCLSADRSRMCGARSPRPTSRRSACSTCASTPTGSSRACRFACGARAARTPAWAARKGMCNMRVDTDGLKPGGQIRMRSASGKYTGVVGEVLEFEPPHRYVHTFRFTQYDDPPCKVIHELREVPGGVEYTLINENV